MLLGEFSVGAYFKDVGVNSSRDEIDVSNFASTAKEFLIGHTDGSVSLGGFFDTATNAIVDQVEDLVGVDTTTAFTVGWTGVTTLHAYAAVMGLKIMEASPKAAVGDAVLYDISGRPTAGPDHGIIASQLGQVAVAAETSRTGYDYGAASTTSNGFAANLHVTGITLSPTLACKLQDSANSTNGVDGTWADITGGAFTNISAAGSQHLTGTASVRRWVRATYTVTGTGLITFMVSFAKRG